jgi:hypothetical protein
VEPPPGADPGRPLYESGAAAVRGGSALPTVDSNHDQRNQSASSYPLDEWASSNGACAARESNSVLRIKSPVHRQLCLRHLSRTGELNSYDQVGSLMSAIRPVRHGESRR